MAVKIRLKRMGKIRAPYYRVVVVDSRKKRDGRVIEEIANPTASAIADRMLQLDTDADLDTHPHPAPGFGSGSTQEG